MTLSLGTSPCRAVEERDLCRLSEAFLDFLEVQSVVWCTAVWNNTETRLRVDNALASANNAFGLHLEPLLRANKE